MATVFAACDERDGSVCAVKVLRPELGARADIRELFAKEAKIGEIVGRHPNIVDVLDAGIDERTGSPFLVMELLRGETLEHTLARGPMPPERAAEVLLELADALDHAHASGLLHRDLKPSNLFLAATGEGVTRLKVMDFGIAKLLERGAVRTATQIGTPAYTAPEQLGATTRRLAASQGIEIARGVSPATDVWALGLIAYELYTGEAPGQYWRSDTLAELPMAIAFEELVPASVRAGERRHLLPLGFDRWFARCLDKNALRRWPSAGVAVRRLLGTAAIPETRPSQAIDLRTVKAAPLGLEAELPLEPSDEAVRPLESGDVAIHSTTGRRTVVVAASLVAVAALVAGLAVRNRRHVREDDLER